MIRLIGVLLVVATGLTACRPFTSEATADLPGQISVTMSVRPMAGWHSDWHRTLTIATPDGTISQPLFEDTGWWRGSNLYLHASGVYVLHEGQAGCILLPTRPLTADDEPDISCDRASPATVAQPPDGQAASAGFPPSLFYRDLFYVGHFAETPDAEEAITFMSFDQQPEPDLPDIL